jgi:predicted  nucleic acid-binding Zn-ribbon protein
MVDFRSPAVKSPRGGRKAVFGMADGFLEKVSSMLRGKPVTAQVPAAPAPESSAPESVEVLRRSIEQIRHLMAENERRINQLNQRMDELRQRVDTLPQAGISDALYDELTAQRQRVTQLHEQQQDVGGTVRDVVKSIDMMADRLRSSDRRQDEQASRLESTAGEQARLQTTLAAAIRVMDQTRDAYVARDAARAVWLDRQVRRSTNMGLIAIIMSLVSAALVVAKLVLNR